MKRDYILITTHKTRQIYVLGTQSQWPECQGHAPNYNKIQYWSQNKNKSTTHFTKLNIFTNVISFSTLKKCDTKFFNYIFKCRTAYCKTYFDCFYLILKQSANKTSYSTTQQQKLCTLVKTLSMLEFHCSTLQ